jgi:hypothetical protein
MPLQDAATTPIMARRPIRRRIKRNAVAKAGQLRDQSSTARDEAC